eukprot:CAMPEP_0198112302 /NCGR_PEP_ID=MMETSP1442-20131203/4158_1 /TAXON_ID= /ORGANISM="Craspedostauros australis, Strain CCMP3328" /LENGTH=620 /DNA_ID=CAMNT_0043769025 /DNA_START=89 /DNA_END=1951 /DNA_ORIENTATION=-
MEADMYRKRNDTNESMDGSGGLDNGRMRTDEENNENDQNTRSGMNGVGEDSVAAGAPDPSEAQELLQPTTPIEQAGNSGKYSVDGTQQADDARNSDTSGADHDVSEHDAVTTTTALLQPEPVATAANTGEVQDGSNGNSNSNDDSKSASSSLYLDEKNHDTRDGSTVAREQRRKRNVALLIFCTILLIAVGTGLGIAVASNRDDSGRGNSRAVAIDRNNTDNVFDHNDDDGDDVNGDGSDDPNSIAPTSTRTSLPTAPPSVIQAAVGSNIPSVSPTAELEQTEEFFAILDELAPFLSDSPNSVQRSAFEDPTSIPHQTVDWMASSGNPAVAQILSNSTNKSQLLTEYYSVVSMYLSLGGSDWIDQHNFLSESVGLCDWNDSDGDSDGDNGVFCDPEGRVIAVRLANNNVSGNFDPSVYNLMELQQLDLSRNPINGTLDAAIGQLRRLRTLRMARTQLQGSLATELGMLTSLVELDLYMNDLNESIPTEFGNLTSLQTLDLGQNHLQGSLPSQLGKMAAMVEILLDGNLLSDAIPTEIGNLANLEVISLFGNGLFGDIPIQFASLRMLDDLDINGTFVTGDLDPIVCAGNVNNDDSESDELPDPDFVVVNDLVRCSCCDDA